MALDNPIDAYLRAAQSQNQNRQQMNQDLAGLGQGLGQSLGNVGNLVKQQKQKQLLAQLVQAMQQQGAKQQGPALPGVGMTQGQPMPASGMGAAPQDNSKQIQALMMQLNPEQAMRMMPSPLQQSEIAKNNALTQKYTAGGSSASAKPVGTIYRNSTTGEMTDDASMAQGPEWKPYKTTQGDVLNKLAGQTSAKKKNAAYSSRAEAMQRGIDVKQIDQLISKTGLTPKQQSTLQMNNQRSARALQILSQPNITWQELSLGEIDLAGIMQGGVPQRDEIVSTHFPGWQQQVAQWKTYATGHPDENVPNDIKKKVGQLVNGVVQVDNRILNANAKFAKNMIGPTIRGGLQPNQAQSIDEMTGVLTNAGGTNNPTTQGGWGIQKVQ